MALLHDGELVRDTYEVERFLGEGAFAEVYRVRHRFLGRQAMKVFKRVGMRLEEIHELLGEAILLKVAPTSGQPIRRMLPWSTCGHTQGLVRITPPSSTECNFMSQLTPHGVLPAAPHELDLLARLAARQGRYDTARCLWRTALRSAPDDAKFVCCLEAIDHAEQRQWLGRAVFLASFWIGLVLAIALLVLRWFQKPHF